MSELSRQYMVVRPDGTEVTRGEQIKDFRGDPAVFERVSRPPTESSGGKIQVRGNRGECYPSLFRLEIRPRA